MTKVLGDVILEAKIKCDLVDFYYTMDGESKMYFEEFAKWFRREPEITTELLVGFLNSLKKGE